MMVEGDQYWLFLIFSMVIAVVSLWVAFSTLRKARMIEDTPTAKIRSAAQGFVELNGTVIGSKEKEVVSPLTDTPCCWYRYSIERKGNKHWYTLEEGVSESPFLIEDETGRCIVVPKGAEVTATDQSIWYGSTRQPEDRNPRSKAVSYSVGGLRMTIDHFYQPFKLSLLLSHYRYREERIYVGDVLYALGNFYSLNENDHAFSKKNISREILRFWKQDSIRMVERFDQNGDGNLDVNEWDIARQKAQDIATQQYERQQSDRILHTLSKPKEKGFPYLISAWPEFNLARRYRRWSGILLMVFFISGGYATFLMTY